MIRFAASRLGEALDHASHSGFPWAMPRVAGGGEGGFSLPLRRAIRRSVVGRWPPRYRLAGRVLMALLWPLGSLRDAVVFSLRIDRAALGGRSRASLALRAWGAALGHNMPPFDYLGYRLFEPGRPGPGCWLHSADAHLHFAALAGPELRELTDDKLAFTDFGLAIGMQMMPVLAVYQGGEAIRPFAGGAPPPCDLLAKPCRGRGGLGQVTWRWDGERHAADDPEAGPGLDAWLSAAARSGDLLVQELARPPERLGTHAPVHPPLLLIMTAQGPAGGSAIAFALVTLTLREGGREVAVSREVDLDSGRVLPVSPGHAEPAWGQPPDRRDCGGFTIPGWHDIMAQIGRFHAALPGPAPVLKWDVILTDRGPRILETNIGAGVFPIQEMTLRPITGTPVGTALEAWAR